MIKSAGILLYRQHAGTEVFLVHPGGPFFARKDAGSWTIPKGEYTADEEALAAACREFMEETGQAIKGPFIALTPVQQKGGKLITAWAVEGDINADHIVSNSFELTWPPNSGKKKTFPEIDRAAWFTLAEARQKINERQAALLVELEKLLQH